MNLFSEYIGSQSLFSDKFLIICDGLLGKKSEREPILERLEEVASSKNVFIFVEEALDKEALKKVEKFAAKVFVFEEKAKKEKIGFNIFSISDALGEKDKKKLWIVFNKAIKEGLAPEEIFWKLTWQAKNMLLGKIAEEKGDRVIEKLKISPYVLKKAKDYSKKFTEEELKKIYGELVRIYHDSRRGEVDFELALEGFILGLK